MQTHSFKAVMGEKTCFDANAIMKSTIVERMAAHFHHGRHPQSYTILP